MIDNKNKEQYMSPITLAAGETHVFCCSFENISGFKGFTDKVSSLGTVFKEFSWSVDGTNWSYWTELNKSNLQAVSVSEHSDVDVKCRYSLNGGPQTSATVYSIEFFPKCSGDDRKFKPFESENGDNTTSQIVDIAQGTFNPYAVNTQYNLYSALSESVTNMFGISSPYFRATPVDRSGDVIFKEWTLYNVDDPKCIKVMINNNEMPDLNPSYNPFGVEYQESFEVEVLKKEFQDVFGVDSIPQKNDILYIPLLSTRLYEVLSSVPNRGFMYQEISWKLTLTIYKPKSNRNLSETSLNAIDGAIDSPIADTIQSEEALFGETLQKEEEKLTVPQILDPFVGTTRDPIRSWVFDGLDIESIDLDNHGVKVANSCYNLYSMLGQPEDKAVIYSKIQNFLPEQDFALTTWVSTVKNPTLASLVKKMSEDNGTVTMTTDKVMTNVSPGDLASVERQGRLSFYGTVTSIESKEVKISVPSYLIEKLDSLSSSWSSANGYVIQKTIPSTLIHGHDGKNGIKLEMFMGRFFVYTVDSTEYFFAIDKKLEEGKWYGVALNHSATFGQAHLSVFMIGDDMKTSKLEEVYSSAKQISKLEEVDRGTVEIQFILKKGLMRQTNIRIYKETIPEDQLSTLLNQFVISDSQNAILVDNAKKVDRLPYLGKIK